MGILDWFKNRQGQFDQNRVSDEIVDWAAEKVIALTNPKLKLLPAVHILSSKAWPDDPVLRVFFVAPSDIQDVLGGSDNLRALFAGGGTAGERTATGFHGGRRLGS